MSPKKTKTPEPVMVPPAPDSPNPMMTPEVLGILETSKTKKGEYRYKLLPSRKLSILEETFIKRLADQMVQTPEMGFMFPGKYVIRKLGGIVVIEPMPEEPDEPASQ